MAVDTAHIDLQESQTQRQDVDTAPLDHHEPQTQRQDVYMAHIGNQESHEAGNRGIQAREKLLIFSWAFILSWYRKDPLKRSTYIDRVKYIYNEE